MNRSVALLVSVLALFLVVAGCGSDDEESDGGSATTTEQPKEQTTPTTGGATAGEVVEVSMKNTRFVPMDVKVKAGDTINWTNNDSIPHTVTKGSGPGAAFDSGTVDGGGTFKRKFDQAGAIDYVCTIHPRQTGTITVE